MKFLVWKNRYGKTHLVRDRVTWCGLGLRVSDVVNEYTTDNPLPFDCQQCLKAWMGRPRKGHAPKELPR